MGSLVTSRTHEIVGMLAPRAAGSLRAAYASGGAPSPLCKDHIAAPILCATCGAALLDDDHVQMVQRGDGWSWVHWPRCAHGSVAS